MDPYKVLGVSREATQEEIKNAYRRLAKKHHPDLNPGNKGAEAKFKELNQANELVGSPEARAKFDRGETEEASAGFGAGAGRGGPFYRQTQDGEGGGRYSFHFGSGGGGGGSAGFDEEVFESLFGGMGRGAGARHRPRGPMQGQDEAYRLEIDLADTVKGATREIRLPTGKNLEVRIPAGVTSGTKLRFQGQGRPGTEGGPPGDVYVELEVRPSELFRVDGRNVVVEIPVQLEDAVLGGEIEAPTLDGPIRLKIPAGVNAGRKLRIAGKGMYDRRSKSRGDEIAVIRIVLPEPIDPAIVEAIRLSRQRKESAA